MVPAAGGGGRSLTNAHDWVWVGGVGGGPSKHEGSMSVMTSGTVGSRRSAGLNRFSTLSENRNSELFTDPGSGGDITAGRSILKKEVIHTFLLWFISVLQKTTVTKGAVSNSNNVNLRGCFLVRGALSSVSSAPSSRCPHSRRRSL